MPSATPSEVSERAAARRAHRLGDAEVGDDRVALGEQHVVRLDVAVDDAVPVGVGERVDHLAQDPHGLGDRQLALARELDPERLALDERHDVVEQIARRRRR